jgi:predicted small secreted protein
MQSLCQSNLCPEVWHGFCTLLGAANDRRRVGVTKMKYLSVLLPLVSAAGLTLLSACNTVEGVGRDLERAGDAIQDEADDTRDRRRRDD